MRARSLSLGMVLGLLGCIAGARAQSMDTSPAQSAVEAGNNGDKQHTIKQLRAITEAVKNCQASEVATAPMNVVWDVEQRSSVRSPTVGFIEFTTRAINHWPDPDDEVCRAKDKACQRRKAAALQEFTQYWANSANLKPVAPEQYRYEFDFGLNGLEFSRALMRAETVDETHWTATRLWNDCPGDAVLSVADDPLNRDTRPSEIPEELWDAANRGEVSAMVNIGALYGSGVGTSQSFAEAGRWYRKAAERGNGDAQINFGNLYYSGKGVPQDYVAAARWYHNAAEQGNKRAQAVLASMYGLGQGVFRDDAESAFWFCVAAPTLGDAAVDKVRAELAGNLTPAKRLEVQERCDKWLEDHPAKH